MKGSRRLRIALIVLFSLGVNIEARAYTSMFYENLLYNRVGKDTRAFVLADLDGDGDLDLATGGREDHAISVWVNRGDGLLTKAGEIPIGRSPRGRSGWIWRIRSPGVERGRKPDRAPQPGEGQVRQRGRLLRGI